MHLPLSKLSLYAAWFVVATLTRTTHGEPLGRSGAIKGQLTSPHGAALRTGRAVVFICDGKSGLPLSPESHKAIDLESEKLFQFDAFWHAVTTDDGGFEFSDVPPGRYRLVAQAWSGISGVPRGVARSLRSDPGEEPSSIVVLHGAADDVVVEAGETTRAYPRQWGNQTLRIVTDPEEPHNYLLISRHPTLGDGVLGPVGWGPQFVAGVMGVTRMEDSHVTLVGLPDGAEVHVALWNYDNSAGFGGKTFIVGEKPSARLPIYAYWSNGKYEPPRRLAKLTDHLQAAAVDVAKTLQIGKPSFSSKYLREVWKRADDQVELAGYGPAKVIDLLAAESYRELAEHHRRRQDRRAHRDNKD